MPGTVNLVKLTRLTGPSREPTIVVLLNKHVVKLPTKYAFVPID